MGCVFRFVPFSIAVVVAGTLCITFYLAYFEYEHVTYFLPYISDTGTYPPESCIFGQALNMVSVLIGLAMYVKYRLVQDIYQKYKINEKFPINTGAFYIGMAACLGTSLIGNFQETNIIWIHWVGALLAFGGGSSYECLQSIIYIKITPIIGQRKTTIFRIFLALVAFISFLVFTTAAIMAYAEYEGGEEHLTRWRALDGGAEVHQVSTILEWICAIAIISFMALYYEEFKTISINTIVTYEKQDYTQNQNE